MLDIKSTLEYIDSTLRDMESAMMIVESQRDEAIYNSISNWHSTPNDFRVHEWLGWTEEEYSIWLSNPGLVPLPKRLDDE